ncbi:Thioredoxin [Nosema bombycis CQ1]|uniref:Thioredoxin n=2 Tax=Nosema bombycis (strain CQ1 / CVCC 102059) TaxID=578461 RepID=R0MLF8_NOSB1|nr:Thioredoxin [Nosema bombycis CQ1]|eukprot:EOB15080.1 Thioredoxin [Nosema bombycis CQ1]
MQVLLLLLFRVSFQLLVETCGSPNKDGLVLTDYYQKWCPACQKLDPVLDEIGNHLERFGVDIHIEKVDCNECKIHDESIKAYPTVVLRKDGVEVNRFSGYKSYDEVKEFLISHTDIESEAFEGHVETEVGKVHELTEDEMYKGLDGAWVVLFYYKGHSLFDDLLNQMAKLYEGKIKIGRISFKESREFIPKLNIKSYPAMFGFYNGLSVPFLSTLTLNEISKFCDRLTEPVLTTIDYESFHNKTSLLENGEPLYVVLHRNETLANEYFFEYAHLYKYKVQMYKSSDPKLFERASIYPQSISDEADHNTHKHAVKLAVYKNGLFYQYTGDINDRDDVAAWIFHTHFSYVTRIDNPTFNTVFNGFKPSLILLTRDEELVNEYNKFSADRHLGTPYLDILFAYLDTAQYDLFVPNLLPNINLPALVIYDPQKKHFRYKPVKLTRENFKHVALNTLRSFEKDKLPLYPPSPSYLKYWILGGGFLIACVLLITSQTKSKKRI